MIKRDLYLEQLAQTTKRSPVTALLGPRQCGKTTLAKMFCQGRDFTYYDLESRPDQQRLQNPEIVLGAARGLVVLDEIQEKPELFSVLRVMADRSTKKTKFLILGSASPQIIKSVSETLAGRIEFVELAGFNISESGNDKWQNLWSRGGFPRSFLARTEADSLAWREGFLRTFLERDIPQLGINIPSSTMRRFWTMLAHYHGQTWNGSELARSLGLSDKTVRGYLDILTDTFMIRQLQPWHENLSKRQVRAPKIYFRDSGLLHSLLNLPDYNSLLSYPRAGAFWEGFVLEQALSLIRPTQTYFWSTHNGAELDLLLFYKGRRFGLEVKFIEAPTVTKSMRVSIQDLKLDHLWVIYPGKHIYPGEEMITFYPFSAIDNLPGRLDKASQMGNLS